MRVRQLLDARRGGRYVQIGLRGYWPGEETFKWQADNGITSFFMHDVRELVSEDGFDLLVAELLGDLVDRSVRERYPRVLGLEAVDQVAEDPAAAAGAEPVVALLAEAAASARGRRRSAGRRDRPRPGSDERYPDAPTRTRAHAPPGAPARPPRDTVRGHRRD